jgi:hypothetical protein
MKQQSNATSFGDMIKEAFGLNLAMKIVKKENVAQPVTTTSDEIAMETFRQRISMHQAAMGTHHQRAPGFDYVRWKQHGQHRMHHNPDEYVLTCQGLSPYINAVAYSSYEGLEERRWAGLTQAPPSLGLQPKSASRSQLGSREMLAKTPR